MDNLVMTQENKSKRKLKIRILLVDDHTNVRTGVRRLLETTRDIVVVGEAGDGYRALELVSELQPDIVILDVEMPRMNGLDAAKQLSEHHPQVKILALSAYDDRQYILGMLDQGATGYMIKDEVPEMLIQAIREISRFDRRWLSKRVETMVRNG